jgi:hypothetical protein
MVGCGCCLARFGGFELLTWFAMFKSFMVYVNTARRPSEALHRGCEGPFTKRARSNEVVYARKQQWSS